MTINSAITTIQRNIRHFGIACAIYDIILRILNKFVFLKILRVIALSEVASEEILPADYRFQRIPIDELTSLSQDPEYALSPVLLHEIRRGENACFGIYDGKTLANYLFIFVTPVLMSDNLEVMFGSRYAYLCAAFTHPKYRGLHMNSISSGLAAQEYFRRGFQGLLAYVESNNFSSLKSFHRIGWRTIGTVYICRIFGRYLIHGGNGCSAYAFRVSPIGKDPDVDSFSGPAQRNPGNRARRQVS